MKNYKSVSYKEFDKKLEKSWNELWLKSEYSYFFNSFNYFLTSIETYKISDYEIFTVVKDDEVCAILPLIKKRVFGITSYVSLGEKFLEKSSLLVKNYDKRLLKILFDSILAKGNIHLSEISKEVSLSLQNIYPRSVLSIISVSPFIDIKQDPFVYVSKKHLNKIINKIDANKKKIKFIHSRKNLNEALNSVVNLEKESYKSIKGKEIFNDALSVSFFKNLINRSKKYLVIDFLTYDNKPFVSLTGVICKKTYYAYHTCYLREFKNLMPGKLIIFFVIKRLKEEGVEIFDFVRGFSNFKEEFTKNYEIQYDFYVSRNNWINVWWKIINLIRRARIVLLRTENSKDYQYLFKNLE